MPLIDSLWKSIGWESILDDPYMKAGILSSVLNQGELFPAFSGAYMKASFGSVMFSIPVRWEGASEGIPADWSFFTGHCSGRNLQRLIVCSPVPERKRMGKKENTCLMIKDEWGNRLPLYPFMEDILPGFMPGQPLLMQVTAVPSIVEAVPLGMNADDLGDGIGYAEEMPGQDHPSRAESFIPGPEGAVYIQGKITAMEERSTAIPDGAGGLSPLSTYMLVTVDTGQGIWNMPVSSSVMRNGFTRLRKGLKVRARAVLSGNPCLGQYQNGMIFNEQEYINALRYALYSGHMDFLSVIMNPSWKFCGASNSREFSYFKGTDAVHQVIPPCGVIDVVKCVFPGDAIRWALRMKIKGRSEKNLVFIHINGQQKISRIRVISENAWPWEYEDNIYHEE